MYYPRITQDIIDFIMAGGKNPLSVRSPCPPTRASPVLPLPYGIKSCVCCACRGCVRQITLFGICVSNCPLAGTVICTQNGTTSLAT